MQQSELDFIKNLRQASPYISQHREKKVVIYLPSSMVQNDSDLHSFVRDVVLINNLGIKTVIVLGASLQINQALTQQKLTWETAQNIRITPSSHIKTIQEVVGLVRSKLEASFTQACAEQHSSLSLISGNWVAAKPKGIIEGVNFQQTGSLRKINTKAINSALDNNQVCLLTPLAYAQSGEVFNLNTLEQAFAISTMLEANKLIIFSSKNILKELPKSLNLADINNLLISSKPDQTSHLLTECLKLSKNVQRIHLVDESKPSSILLELFTRDGIGTLIYTDRYYQIRSAKQDDIAGIIRLIKPLENTGVLAFRNNEFIENDINHFIVAEIDNQIIGCSAIYTYSNNMAELSCLAVDPDNQGKEIGESLLLKSIQRAKEQNMSSLFILTTQTDHWFKEQGFYEADIKQLPKEKQQKYNQQRRSKIMIKNLNNE